MLKCIDNCKTEQDPATAIAIKYPVEAPLTPLIRAKYVPIRRLTHAATKFEVATSRGRCRAMSARFRQIVIPSKIGANMAM